MAERRRPPESSFVGPAPSATRIDRELEETEARYRTLFEQSPLGVFTYDRALRLTDCNAAFVRLLESSYEKLIGLDLRLLRDTRIVPSLERVLDGEPMYYEGAYEATTSLAKVRVAMWLTPLRSADGDVMGGIGIVQDVTEERAATHALARSEANFRALIEHAPDAIGVFRNGEHLYVNPKLAALLGYGHEEHFAKSIHELIHVDDHPLLRERAERRDRGEMLPPAEFHLVHRDGHLIVAEITSINVQYDGGPAVLCFLRDVTERKQMQARLVQADRLASVGMLAAGIAHEINNPLAYLMTSLELLARFRLPELEKGATSDAQREAIRAIGETIEQTREGAERMRRIVRDVKSFARGDDDARAPIDVRKAIDAALQLVRHEVRQRARLVHEVGDEPLVVDASESRLGQVFLNLLVNAVQAMKEGEDHELAVRARREDGSIVVEVKDDGDGIAPEALSRVFDPFFTTKPLGEGTGLGLFVCHGIVASLGGSIQLDSAKGSGTTVRVRLPAAASDAPSETIGASSSEPLRRARVLLVDDEPSLGRALAAAMSDEHDVVIATSGEEALAILSGDDRFDVVLCDLMMPGTTGIDVWRRTAATRPAISRRFIFVTGGAFTPEAMAFLDEGHPYLEKPFDLRELRALLRERLDRPLR